MARDFCTALLICVSHKNKLRDFSSLCRFYCEGWLLFLVFFCLFVLNNQPIALVNSHIASILSSQLTLDKTLSTQSHCVLPFFVLGCGSTCTVSSWRLFHKPLLIAVHHVSCTTGSTTGTLAPIALFLFHK